MEKERTTILITLESLYRERAAIQKATGSHDTSLTYKQDNEIVKLEQTLREEYGEPFRLVSLRYRSAAGEEALPAWNQAQPWAAKLQRLSLAGRRPSVEFRGAAQQLENLGVSFACLYSDEETAVVVFGGKGYLHNDVRNWVATARDGGSKFPARAEVSGFVIALNPGEYVFMADNPKLIWTRALAVDDKQYTYADTLDFTSGEMGIAQLADQDLFTLGIGRTDFMEQILTATAGRMR